MAPTDSPTNRENATKRLRAWLGIYLVPAFDLMDRSLIRNRTAVTDVKTPPIIQPAQWASVVRSAEVARVSKVKQAARKIGGLV